MRLLFVIFIFLVGGCAPTFEYNYFFSETEGKVLVDGKPVSGITIKRWYRSNWYENDTLETTTTDDDGYFYFSDGREFSFIGVAHEPVIYQTIKIQYGNKEYLGWEYTKSTYDKNEEVGKQINIVCELTNNESKQTIHGKRYGNYYNGLCRI